MSQSGWGTAPRNSWAPGAAQGNAASSAGSLAPHNARSQGNQDGKLRFVQLDGLALLKIIKHCTQSLPELCAGSLLGLDIENRLEVTNCFPFPVNAQDTPDYDGTEYQNEMMKLLRDVNVDYNSVGWYRSTYMGSFCTADLVEQQFHHQDALDQGSGQAKSVVLIYDPFQTEKGTLAIKAYRLTEKFMNEYRAQKNGKFTKELELNSDIIMEEVPIHITNAEIVSVLLNDISTQHKMKQNVDFDRFDLSTNPYLEKNLEFLVEEVESLAQEQQKVHIHQRQVHKQKMQQAKWLAQRKAENEARKARGEAPLPEEDPNNPIFKQIPNPSKLESLLIRNQIDVYCNQINKFSAGSLSKLFLLGNVQK